MIVKPDGLRYWLTFYAQRLFMLPALWLVFRVLNRVEVEGVEHLAELEGRSVILCPNHRTAWDSWVGTVWALSSRRRLVARDSYMGVLAAPENVPTVPLRILTSILGAIPVDRQQGVDQHALQDTARIMQDPRRKVVLTVFPEGTRSRTGRMRRRGRPGIGWLQHKTGAPVVPIYHSGGEGMPGIGLKLKIRIGKPLYLEAHREAPDELSTWRAITADVMRALHAMEDEARAEGDVRPPRRGPPRWRGRTRRASSRVPSA